MNIPRNSIIITSDDVFDYLLDIRYINSGIDKKRNELFETYFDKRNVSSEEARLRSLDDYDRWRDIADAKHSKKPNPTPFVRDRVMRNVQERSNGESALMYFTEEGNLKSEPRAHESSAASISLKFIVSASSL